jgi:prephenate dehydrogenase
MAGKELRGVEHSDPFLFAQRTWFLAPPSPSVLDSPRVEEFTGWLSRIGAVPVTISPSEHDEVVSFTSHLPQLLSTTLAALLSERVVPERADAAAGPGLHDMTRLAKSSYEIWTDILETNSDHVAEALDRFLDRLSHVRRQLPESKGKSGRELASEFEIACNFAKRLRKTHI